MTGIHDGFPWEATGTTSLSFRFRTRDGARPLWQADCLLSDYSDNALVALTRAIKAFDGWRRLENLAFATATPCANCGIAEQKHGCAPSACKATSVAVASPLARLLGLPG
jgi:hypothetical protein